MRVVDSCTQEDVQKFLETNTVFFHRFSPTRIKPKAPILSRYKTDFAILDSRGMLVLVEIEPPKTKLIKRNGDISQALQHSFDQVRAWLDVAHRQWHAVLECMDCRHGDVAGVRGIVVAGRDQPVRVEHLMRLKGADHGQIDFYTFDDLLEDVLNLTRDGAAWVGDVISSCQVLASGAWIPNDAVDHVVYCLERRLGTYAQQGYFPTRSIPPTDWSSPVTPPYGWNPDDVRNQWQGNLYPAGPVFTLIVSISGPTLIESPGSYTWQANASGGNGSFSYEWYVHYFANANTDALGTSQMQGLYVTGFGNFQMIVNVTSGGGSASDTLYVQNEVGGGGGGGERLRGPGRPTVRVGNPRSPRPAIGKARPQP